MRSALVVLCLLLPFAAFAPAASIQDQSQPKPKKQRAPKPKKHEPTVVIIDAIDKSTPVETESMMRKFYAQAGMLEVLNTDKKYENVPPIIERALVDQLGIDFSNPDNWTADSFGKMAVSPDAQLVVATEILSLTLSQPSDTSKKTGPNSMTASVDIATWLYDVKQQKFLMQGEKLHWNYLAKKGEDKIDPKSVGYEVILQAVRHAFKDVAKAKR